MTITFAGVPRLLTQQDKKVSVLLSRAFLKQYTNEDVFLQRIITTDETWLYYYDP